MLNEIKKDIKKLLKNREINILGIMLVVYILVSIYFYPPYFETSDSKTYLAQAYLLSEGKLFEKNPLESYNLRNMNGKFSSFYPLGQSVWLMPFIKLGLDFAFLSGIIGHLLGWIAFILILQKNEIKLKYSGLFLFFPPLIYYSRTLMAETMSITLILLGIYFYILENKKSLFICGFLFGLSAWFRLTNPIIALPFIATLFFKNKQNFLYALVPFILVITALISFNIVNYESVDTYSLGGEKNFMRIENNFMILNYFLVLLIGFLPFLSMQYFFFPGLILGLNFLNEKLKLEIIFSTILSTIFFGFFGIDSARYIVPNATMLLISYPKILENAKEKLVKLTKPENLEVIKTIIILSWFISLITILSINQSNLIETKEIAKKIYSETSENSLIIGSYDVEKFLYKGNGKRKFLKSEEIPSNEKISELKKEFKEIFYITIYYEKKMPINIFERFKGKSNYQITIKKIA